MKLATINNGSRDGKLIVVSRDLTTAVDVSDITPTLQIALENWQTVCPSLLRLSDELNKNAVAETFSFQPQNALPPLPRAFQWCDGSAFLNHGRLMERAFGNAPIPDFETIPLMYQGGSDDFLAPFADVPLPDEAHGIDFEGEFAVVTDDVPLGCSTADAEDHVKLLMLVNDWSLRNFGPREMKTGFGFLQAKPATAFAPVAVTPDELGENWVNGRVNLPLEVFWNNEKFGAPRGDEMDFSFYELIAHAAKTRRLRAGAIIGSGTISNRDRTVGSACISERRVLEIIEHGAPKTDFMRFGDTVKMETFDRSERSVFGKIEQKVIRATVNGNH